MENIWSWVIENWEFIAAALVASGAIDAGMGLIPDKYVGYIGIIRRFVETFRKGKAKA